MTAHGLMLVCMHQCIYSLTFLVFSPVKLTLDAIKQLLPRDVAVQVLSRCYFIQNTAGSANGQSDWSRFSQCLLGLMGYDLTQVS